MPFKLVTCPETAHLELLAYEDHPLGTLVVECSRFPEELDCPRTCTERLDQRSRRRRELEPEVCSVLGVGDETNLGMAVTLGEAPRCAGCVDRRLQASDP
jgi:hypothetical protein